jgi:hypothetical protein
VDERSWLLIGHGALLGVLAALALGATTARGDSGGPPVSTVSPTMTGSPGVGKTLATTTGSWSTSATFTYEWLRCAANYTGCANIQGQVTYTVIPGATAASYTPVADDVGHILEARVTATNAAGSVSALSQGRGPVEAQPPGVKHRPWIGGTKRVGQTDYEIGTHWTRSPYTFTDQWLRCSAKGKACVRIRGERLRCANGTCIRIKIGVQPDYQLTKTDLGHRIRVRVTAWNGAGHTTSTSTPTRIIKK